MPKKRRLEEGAYLVRSSKKMRSEMILIKFHLGMFLMKGDSLRKEAESLLSAVNEFDVHSNEVFPDPDSD